jgi:hypothetical protein
MNIKGNLIFIGILIAIAIALRDGHLKLRQYVSRFGDTYIAISDKHGIIEVQDDWDCANARVKKIEEICNAA